MPGFYEPVSHAVFAIDWEAQHEITQKVKTAAARCGLPSIPIFEVVDVREGHAWLQLARLCGVLPPPELPRVPDEPELPVSS